MAKVDEIMWSYGFVVGAINVLVDNFFKDESNKQELKTELRFHLRKILDAALEKVEEEG